MAPSRTQIHHLPADIFLTIFSYLSIIDISNTSLALKMHGHVVSVAIDVIEKIATRELCVHNNHMQFASVINNYGYLFLKITVNGRYRAATKERIGNNNLIVEAINTNCSLTLTELKIKCCLTNVNFSVFRKLSILKFHSSRLGGSLRGLNTSPNLNRLELLGTIIDNPKNILLSFSALKHLSISLNKTNLTEEIFITFFKLNPQLESLDLFCKNMSSTFIENLNQNCPRLSSLKLFLGAKQENEITASVYFVKLLFRNLKSLTIVTYGNCNKIFNYMGISIDPLEEITLAGDLWSFNAVSFHVNLKKITLNVRSLNLNVFTAILPPLSKLLEIKIFFDELVDTISEDIIRLMSLCQQCQYVQIGSDQGHEVIKFDEDFYKNCTFLLQSGVQIKIVIGDQKFSFNKVFS